MAEFRLASGYDADTARIRRGYRADMARLLRGCCAAAVRLLCGCHAGWGGVRVRVALGCSRRYACPHRDAGCNGCGDGCVGSLVTRCDASLRCGASVAAAPAAIGTSRQPAELTANGSAFTPARHRSSVAAPSVADLPIGNARSSERGVFPFAVQGQLRNVVTSSASRRCHGRCHLRGQWCSHLLRHLCGHFHGQLLCYLRGHLGCHSRCHLRCHPRRVFSKIHTQPDM